ncbi:glycerate kinase [Kribbella sp. NPDC050124]|uniref:glycerate kinase n=1 Tax=Kribbella sp. NPDC050124 TaxID=3364114 RepID=UPI0037B33583
MATDQEMAVPMVTAPTMAKIRNTDSLLRIGDTEARQIVLKIADAVLQRMDAYERIKSIMSLDGDVLTVGSRSWDLSTKRNVYLVGAGKACNHMAMAVDEILGDRLTRGIAIVKVAEASDRFRRTEIHVGGHPIPNQAGYDASRAILDLADKAGPDDLFIAVISGGSSALMNCPVDGIDLRDEMAATDVLLKSGAGIYEINAIRRHISQTNGGRLAQRIAASGAELIGFGISDAVGNAPTDDIGEPFPAYASTPIGPDRTTLADARRVIDEYDLADRLPASVVSYLKNAGPESETPKAFPENTYYLINTLADSSIYAKEVAEGLGLPALIVTSFLEGESRDAGTFLASVAREIQVNNNPIAPPCVLVATGETTTQIVNPQSIEGHGGPGHELAAAFAIGAAKVTGAAALSIDTEGTDGTTPAAGAVTDSTSLARARANGVSLHTALRSHASHEALLEIGDVIDTGNTGTNVCDLNLVYVPAQVGPLR